MLFFECRDKDRLSTDAAPHSHIEQAKECNEEEERAFMNETASSKFEILFVRIFALQNRYK